MKESKIVERIITQLICDDCGTDDDQCEICGYEFKNRDQVFCYEGGIVNRHFCSKSCFDKWLKEGTNALQKI